jgi:hypothetical protein
MQADQVVQSNALDGGGPSINFSPTISTATPPRSAFAGAFAASELARSIVNSVCMSDSAQQFYSDGSEFVVDLR